METRQQHIVEIGFDDDFGESEERENQEALPSSDNRTIAPPPGQNRVGPISEDISQVESRFLHLHFVYFPSSRDCTIITIIITIIISHIPPSPSHSSLFLFSHLNSPYYHSNTFTSEQGLLKTFRRFPSLFSAQPVITPDLRPSAPPPPPLQRRTETSLIDWP